MHCSMRPTLSVTTLYAFQSLRAGTSSSNPVTYWIGKFRDGSTRSTEIYPRSAY